MIVPYRYHICSFTRLQTMCSAPKSDHKTLKKGAVRLTSPSISIRMTAIFYGVTKERHSVRATSLLSLDVFRFESDLCELNKL